MFRGFDKYRRIQGAAFVRIQERAFEMDAPDCSMPLFPLGLMPAISYARCEDISLARMRGRNSL